MSLFQSKDIDTDTVRFKKFEYLEIMVKFILCVNLYLLLLLFSSNVSAQKKNIAHFSVWSPKAGQEQNFEAGYKKHLLWHKTSGDKWDWYGWYIASGPRFGQFVDATFDHSWSDFDAPVNPAGDAADNALHTVPFGDFLTAFKVSKVQGLSSADNAALKSNFLRLVTLNVSDVSEGLKIVEKLKIKYSTDSIKNFLTFKIIDGGNTNHIILILGFNSYAEFGKTENLQEDLAAIENSQKTKVITTVNSETMFYKANMSLFAEQKK